MRFLSVCSGIEAASVAWQPLGWKAAAFSEIEPFPCSVLAHHYPDVPNLGDMNNFKDWPDGLAIDLLCGGTPCQSFSVAGLRKGLDDPRGNLMLTYGAIAAKYRPRWLVWENVPGVLSSDEGRDFASFLGLLSGQVVDVPEGGWSNSGIVAGIPDAYGLAYRVLDAQYFGVPQRRRRVFVVGCLGDWRSAAAVLLERHSMSGNPAPRRKPGERPTGTLSARTEGGGGLGTDFELGGGLIAGTLQASGKAAGSATQQDAEAGMLVSIAFNWQGGGTQTTLGYDPQVNTAATLVKDQTQAVHTEMKVRRLTPEECEALQGYRRGYTAVPYRGKSATDGPRYRALGNSWAVPCARWIGERIQAVEAITNKQLESA